MSWLSSKPPVDPARLAIAVHEIGHLVAWQQMRGVRTRHVRLACGLLGGMSGSVSMDYRRTDNEPDSDRLYLVGFLAGTEAQRVFCERTGTRFTRGDANDMASFRKTRRNHKPSRQWSESTLRTQARRLVTANWDQVERLADRLARTGRL